MSTCSCGKKFDDEHGHGVCFGCKIQGITFASVDTGPSKMFREKQEVADILATGAEPIPNKDLKPLEEFGQKREGFSDKIKRDIHEQFYASAP